MTVGLLEAGMGPVEAAIAADAASRRRVVAPTAGAVLLGLRAVAGRLHERAELADSHLVFPEQERPADLHPVPRVFVGEIAGVAAVCAEGLRDGLGRLVAPHRKLARGNLHERHPDRVDGFGERNAGRGCCRDRQAGPGRDDRP